MCVCVFPFENRNPNDSIRLFPTSCYCNKHPAKNLLLGCNV